MAKSSSKLPPTHGLSYPNSGRPIRAIVLANGQFPVWCTANAITESEFSVLAARTSLALSTRFLARTQRWQWPMPSKPFLSIIQVNASGSSMRLRPNPSFKRTCLRHAA